MSLIAVPNRKKLRMDYAWPTYLSELRGRDPGKYQRSRAIVEKIQRIAINEGALGLDTSMPDNLWDKVLTFWNSNRVHTWEWSYRQKGCISSAFSNKKKELVHLIELHNMHVRSDQALSTGVLGAAYSDSEATMTDIDDEQDTESQNTESQTDATQTGDDERESDMDVDEESTVKAESDICEQDWHEVEAASSNDREDTASTTVVSHNNKAHEDYPKELDIEDDEIAALTDTEVAELTSEEATDLGFLIPRHIFDQADDFVRRLAPENRPAFIYGLSLALDRLEADLDVSVGFWGKYHGGKGVHLLQ